MLPVYHIAESPRNDVEVIIVPPALPPLDAMPPTIARKKKKRKKATALATPRATSEDSLAAKPTPSTAPTTKKGKMTSNKKATKPIDLCTAPMWAKTTDGAIDCIMAIAQGQMWVVGNAATIIDDIINKALSRCQWYQKGLSDKRIAPEIQTLLTCGPLISSSTCCHQSSWH